MVQNQSIMAHCLNQNKICVVVFLAMGIIPSPFDCFLVNRSLKTLSVRMDRHIENAREVAAFLVKHPMVESVIFPGGYSLINLYCLIDD